MKKNIITLIAVVLGAISVVIALYIFSIQKVLFSKNGFNRSFIANNIQLKHKYFLSLKASEVLKITDEGVYIVNENRTDIFLYNFKELKSLNYKSLLNQTKIPFLHRIYIDRDTALVVYPPKKIIYKSNLGDNNGLKRYDSIQFFNPIETLGFSSKTYFIIGEDVLSNAAYFTLVKNQSIDSLNFGKNELVENTRKGIIADDGFFISAENHCIYAKYHKNEFFVMDDMDNKKFKTIANKIAYPRIHESPNGSVTIMGEVEYKNMRGAIDDNTLYLQSGVKADNEKAFRFKFNSIIDTYSLNQETATYQNSFYIPSYAGLKCNSFIVKDNILYALYGNYLLTYTIHNEK